MKGAGGTEGGVAQFFVGLAMAVGGAYLLTQRVTVTSGFWAFFGGHTFGLSLLPLVVGAGVLFYDGKSRLGWLLTAGGVLIVFLGILLNLRIYFEPTTSSTLSSCSFCWPGESASSRGRSGRRGRRESKNVPPRYLFSCPLASIRVQVSFRVTVRLKTGCAGRRVGVDAEVAEPLELEPARRPAPPPAPARRGSRSATSSEFGFRLRREVLPSARSGSGSVKRWS